MMSLSPDLTARQQAPRHRLGRRSSPVCDPWFGGLFRQGEGRGLDFRIEVEAAPIMYVAQLMGGTTEQAIRLLILLMVLTCDPLALALTAAASRPKAK